MLYCVFSIHHAIYSDSKQYRYIIGLSSRLFNKESIHQIQHLHIGVGPKSKHRMTL